MISNICLLPPPLHPRIGQPVVVIDVVVNMGIARCSTSGWHTFNRHCTAISTWPSAPPEINHGYPYHQSHHRIRCHSSSSPPSHRRRSTICQYRSHRRHHGSPHTKTGTCSTRGLASPSPPRWRKEVEVWPSGHGRRNTHLLSPTRLVFCLLRDSPGIEPEIYSISTMPNSLLGTR